MGNISLYKKFSFSPPTLTMSEQVWKFAVKIQLLICSNFCRCTASVVRMLWGDFVDAPLSDQFKPVEH